MFLVRAAFWLSLVIFLMPIDERRQARLSGTAGAAVERAATFCERNPRTCAAGAELWSTFLKKAEFTLQLATSIVNDRMTKGDAKRGATAANAPDQTLRTGPDPSPARDLAPHGRDRSVRLGL